MIIETPHTPVPAPAHTPEDFKESTSSKGSLSKFDHDLFHEEDHVVLPVIRIKSVSMPNNGRKWRIMQDQKIVFTIESTKINKTEKQFLQTVEGFNFMLSQAKKGIKSLNAFKTELKTLLRQTIDPAKPKRGRPRKTKK
jgi:hypothetical protein